MVSSQWVSSQFSFREAQSPMFTAESLRTAWKLYLPGGFFQNGITVIYDGRGNDVWRETMVWKAGSYGK